MSKPRKPEVTGKDAASIAGLILRCPNWFVFLDKTPLHPAWQAVQKVAASALTQAADSPKWSALPVKAAPRLKRMMRECIANAEQTMGRPKRGAGAKPLGKFKRRVNLRVRPRPSK